MRFQKGYTLVEVVVSLFILGVLVAIGIFSLYEYLPTFRLNMAARFLKADIGFARKLATKNNCQYRILFHEDGTVYEIQKGNASSSSNWEPPEQIEVVRNFNDHNSGCEGIKFKANNHPIFHPNGIVAPTVGITLTNARNEKRKVTISVAGRIKIARLLFYFDES